MATVADLCMRPSSSSIHGDMPGTESLRCAPSGTTSATLPSWCERAGERECEFGGVRGENASLGFVAEAEVEAEVEAEGCEACAYVLLLEDGVTTDDLDAFGEASGLTKVRRYPARVEATVGAPKS